LATFFRKSPAKSILGATEIHHPDLHYQVGRHLKRSKEDKTSTTSVHDVDSVNTGAALRAEPGATVSA
jgi:hypothetical protein